MFIRNEAAGGAEIDIAIAGYPADLDVLLRYVSTKGSYSIMPTDSNAARPPATIWGSTMRKIFSNYEDFRYNDKPFYASLPIIGEPGMSGGPLISRTSDGTFTIGVCSSGNGYRSTSNYRLFDERVKRVIGAVLSGNVVEFNAELRKDEIYKDWALRA